MKRKHRADNPAAREVLDCVRRIVRALRISSRAAEKNVGLSAAQLFVMSRLASEPAMSLNELADRTLTHQSSASVVVTKLVQRKLVQRTQSPHDRRRMELSLTPAGRALLRKAPGAAQEQLIDALRLMSQSDVKSLARLLCAFVEKAGMGDEQPALMFDDGNGAAKSPPRRRRSQD
jgi:DNA-binding MarR family transcriptional regulator